MLVSGTGPGFLNSIMAVHVCKINLLGSNTPSVIVQIILQILNKKDTSTSHKYYKTTFRNMNLRSHIVFNNYLYYLRTKLVPLNLLK